MTAWWVRPSTRHTMMVVRSGIFRTIHAFCRLKSTAKASRIPPAGPKGPPLPPLESTPLKRAPRTMLHYIHEMQRRYPEAVVLTQVGSFMELYFEQAVKFGPLLNLKVARSPIKSHDFVNMAGFPLLHKEKYERMIVQDLGKTVVTLMQDSKYVLSGGSEEEKRPVNRVLTPGTLLAEDYVDKSVNNYLAAVHLYVAGAVGVAWVDVASGKAKYQVVARAELGNTLARILPSEVLVDSKSTKENLEFARETVAEYAPLAVFTKTPYAPVEYWSVRATHSERFHIDRIPVTARRAFVGLVRYIDECIPGSPIDIQEPELMTQTMQLDARAREALEISSRSSRSSSLASSPDSGEGSLFSTIRRTKTPSGSRLLQDWISAPLQSTTLIKERQDRVEFLVNQSRVIVQHLQMMLAKLPDGPRLLQKFCLPKIDPLDLVAFAKSIKTFEEIAELMLPLENLPEAWQEHFETLTGPVALADYILRAINTDAIVAQSAASSDESLENSATAEEEKSAITTASAGVEADAPKKAKSKGKKQPKASSPHKFAPATNRDYIPVLNASVTPAIQAIHEQQNEFAERESRILARVQDEYGLGTELRWSPSHQFCVRVIPNARKKIPADKLITQTKSTAYVSDIEWMQLGSERVELSDRLREAEERVFFDMRDTIMAQHLSTMRKMYAFLDELDVELSFATLALEKRLVRPEVVDDPQVFEIEDGRHITVETGLVLGGWAPVGFVANDCSLSAPQPLCMVTGPNMGGKSTYIRQSALIALLAHIGCFVPAASARIGIVDRIFCRIGAGDDLYRGRSTFMMEMLETATILNNATDRSLAILDEVGRGTSGTDGIAIAFATIKHLVVDKQCRTLFATHYGEEIWDLVRKANKTSKITEKIRLLQATMEVSRDGEPVFDYNLKPGIASSSGGLLIAEMAGFPESALKDAQLIIAAN